MEIKSILNFGKKERMLMRVLYSSSLPAGAKLGLEHISWRLVEDGLVEESLGCLVLTEIGREICRNNFREVFQDLGDNVEKYRQKLIRISGNKEPEESRRLKAAEFEPVKLTRKEIRFIRFLAQGPQERSVLRGIKYILPRLENLDMVTERDEKILIAANGIDALSAFQDISCRKATNDEFISYSKAAANNAKVVKSEVFLSLYRQGHTYEQIGSLYGITRERVRQILNCHSEFGTFQLERQAARDQAEILQKEERRLKAIEKSLAVKFHERVDELWDWEKNGDLNPAAISAHSSSYEVWLLCPEDGHSWKKKPCDIVTSWHRGGTSGCPKCAGKLRRSEKNPLLEEVYSEFVKLYWDREANDKAGIELTKIRCSSNRRGHFRCPKDGYKWAASISSAVHQQWSKGRSGCKRCNGTEFRRQGKWGKAAKLRERFPEQFSLYWMGIANEKIGIDATNITCGSSRRAKFMCPRDGYVWEAAICAITSSWSAGRSGCPECRRRRGFGGFGSRNVAANMINSL